MNKTVKSLLIITGIVVIFIVGAVALLGIQFNMEMKRFSLIETSQRLPSGYEVKTGISDLFLIPNEDGTFISIDAGVNSATDIREMKLLKIDPQKITTVLATHSINSNCCACARN